MIDQHAQHVASACHDLPATVDQAGRQFSDFRIILGLQLPDRVAVTATAFRDPERFVIVRALDCRHLISQVLSPYGSTVLRTEAG